MERKVVKFEKVSERNRLVSKKFKKIVGKTVKC